MLTASDSASASGGAAAAGEPAASGRAAALTGAALAAAGVLPVPALALAGLALPAHVGATLAATAAAAPALTGLAVIWRGLGRVRAALTRDMLAASAIRVLVATVVLASVLGLIAAQPREGGLAPTLVVATMALAWAWLLLLYGILRPLPSPLRSHAAAAGDIGFASLLLHVGGALTAAWFPLYLWPVFDSGMRLGIVGLALTAAISIAGFAVTAALTPFWAQQPLLSAGVVGAIALVAGQAWLVLARRARAGAAEGAAEGAPGRFLALVAEELRRPVETIRRLGAEVAAGRAEPQDIAAAITASATALVAQCEDLVELAEFEARGGAPEAVPFDLHEIVSDAAALVREQAAARGVAITLRIDPRIPCCLVGAPLLLRRVLIGLAAAIADHAVRGPVRVSLDAAGQDELGDRAQVAIAVRAERIDGDAERLDHLGLAVARRIAGLLGAQIGCTQTAAGGAVLAVALEFAVDRERMAARLDLGHRLVLIASEDGQFAGELGTTLVAWQADPRWIGGIGEAGAHLAGLGGEDGRTVLIVDGRADVLQTLARAHRLAAAYPVFVLFVTGESWAASLAGVADPEIAGILPAPVTPEVLASALHALPFAAAAPKPARAPAPGEHAIAPRATAGPGAAAAKRLLRILVADDNAANRRIVERILGAAGHSVDLVDSGEDMLAAFEAHPVDVVLIDLNLPGGGGYELARACRMTHPGVPILALSAEFGEAIERRCAEAGIDAVLTKPIEPSRLTGAVEAAIGAAAARPAVEPSAVVRPISSHPRFAADISATVDEAAIAALRSLGRGSAFLHEVVEAFRGDAGQLLDQIGSAVAAGDLRGFVGAIESLRRCAANVGAVRLVDVLGAMRELGSADLRRDGAAHLNRITAELAKLEAALDECADRAEFAGR